jgi:endonuclease YncB( thermonuclease family)
MQLNPVTLLAGTFLLLAGWYLGHLLRRWLWQPMKLLVAIDGDTFDAIDRFGDRLRLRLYAVDCPELGQPKGLEARKFAQQWSANRWVRVRLRGRDRYGRHLAEVQADGEDLATRLVREGLAFPLEHAAWHIRRAEIAARLFRRGVWRSLRVRKPWESRTRSRLYRLAYPFLRRRSGAKRRSSR